MGHPAKSVRRYVCGRRAGNKNHTFSRKAERKHEHAAGIEPPICGSTLADLERRLAAIVPEVAR